MKKNIIITEQDINNIILQTLNEMVQNPRWIESYIKTLQNFNNNTNPNRYISNLYELLYSNQRYFTTDYLSKLIKSRILSSKNSDSSINLFVSEDEVYQTINPYFVMSFIGINVNETIESAIKQREYQGKKWTDDKRNSVIRDITKINDNKNSLLDYIKENSDSIDYVKLQKLSCYLYTSCYYLIANVYGIEDSGDLTSKSNHSYDDNFDIEDKDDANINYDANLFDALKQTEYEINKKYGDISPNYSKFFSEVIDWVNKNDDIIKQKFNDILAEYKRLTRTKNAEYLGLTKGVKFTLLALYLGRYVPKVVYRLNRIYNIDTGGWAGFIEELEKVNNGITDWETLNNLTQKIVNEKDIRVILYKLIRNILRNNPSITYDDYIYGLKTIFTGTDIEGGGIKSKTFAVHSGFSNEITPKGINVYSYWKFYEDYFYKLGGTQHFKNLQEFLIKKLGKLNNKTKYINLIKYIYGIFYKMNMKFNEYIKDNKIKQQNKINEISKHLFIKIDNEINNEINKLNNGETKLTDSDIKKNATTISDKMDIAESKIKQIIYETIKRYLK